VLRNDEHNNSFAAPLLLWLLIQLLALTLAAARVKLWARFSTAGEVYALDELIVAQFLASSLLFPFLCRSSRSALAMTLSSVPMIALAGFLSWSTLEQCGWIALNLALWLAALGTWWRVVEGSPFDLIAVAIASVMNIAGPIVVYLSTESRGADLSKCAACIPVLAALRIYHFGSISTLLPCGILLATGLIAYAAKRASLSTAVIH
jgi:hypothetical protein